MEAVKYLLTYTKFQKLGILQAKKVNIVTMLQTFSHRRSGLQAVHFNMAKNLEGAFC